MTDEFARQAAQLADIDRRLRSLEGGQRSGLSSIGSTGGNDFLESLTPGPAWHVTGTSPSVTIETGSRVLIAASAEFTAFGARTASFDVICAAVSMGVGIDTADPTAAQSRTAGHHATDNAGNPVAIWGAEPVNVLTFVDIEPGEHTFEMMYRAPVTAGAAAIAPTVYMPILLVIPLGWA